MVCHLLRGRFGGGGGEVTRVNPPKSLLHKAPKHGPCFWRMISNRAFEQGNPQCVISSTSKNDVFHRVRTLETSICSQQAFSINMEGNAVHGSFWCSVGVEGREQGRGRWSRLAFCQRMVLILIRIQVKDVHKGTIVSDHLFKFWLYPYVHNSCHLFKQVTVNS